MIPTLPAPAVFPHRWIVSLLVISILAALLVAGVSCADSPRDASADVGVGFGDAGSSGFTGACAVPDPGPLDFIDDMEDGNANIIWRQGRNSEWYTYHDTTDGILVPDQGAPIAMEPIPGGRCEYSRRAMRVTGSGFSDWGAGFGFAFRYAGGAKGSYDGSGARGITFWARVGDPSITLVHFGLNDQWSAPEGAHCDMSVTSGPTGCYDSFGAMVPLTTEWQRYAYSWGQLGQRMFGMPRPELDAAHLYDLHFDVPISSPVFDVWIDDIAFFQ